MSTNVRNLSSVAWESGPDRKLAHNTWRSSVYLNSDTGSTAPCVIFHRTTIITALPGGRYILNTGGHRTVTTKQRLNALLPGGIHIHQRNFDWFITTADGEVPFFDQMIVTV